MATVALSLFAIMAAWLLWDEFGVRFNFIAVLVVLRQGASYPCSPGTPR